MNRMTIEYLKIKILELLKSEEFVVVGITDNKIIVSNNKYMITLSRPSNDYQYNVLVLEYVPSGIKFDDSNEHIVYDMQSTIKQSMIISDLNKHGTDSDIFVIIHNLATKKSVVKVVIEESFKHIDKNKVVSKITENSPKPSILNNLTKTDTLNVLDVDDANTIDIDVLSDVLFTFYNFSDNLVMFEGSVNGIDTWIVSDIKHLIDFDNTITYEEICEQSDDVSVYMGTPFNKVEVI